MHIYISTGEVSGEQHAAGLTRACARLCPDTRFTAMGSGILREAGVEIAIDSSRIKVMGFVAIVRHLPAIWEAFRQTLRHVETTRPDAVVLVDYPGFHLRLAKALKKRFPSLPVIYYITPQVWAWHRSRVKTIRACVDHCLCILPFEPAFFQSNGVSAEYVGSPVADAVRGVERGAVRRLLGLADDARLVSIFPGSRRKEIQYLLPPMVDAARLLRERVPGLAFAMAAAPGYDAADLGRYCPIPEWLPVLEGRGREMLADSVFCIAKSGTTTLEAALLGCPLLMAYAGDWLSAIIARAIVRFSPHMKHYSLPNIIAGREVIPEFLQEDCTGEKFAAFAGKMLSDAEAYEKMRRDLDEVRRAVGDRDAAATAAQALMRRLGAGA